MSINYWVLIELKQGCRYKVNSESSNMKKAITIYFIITITFITLVAACSSKPKVKKDPALIVAPFDGEKFNNIEPFADKNIFDVIGWKLSSLFTRKSWEEVKNQKIYKPEVERSDKLRIAIINHATALIQLDQLNILTDSHFSQRACTVSWAGPKRVVQPGISFEDLPPIDAVVVSHDHYDQLDIPTLKKLSDKWAPLIYVGLGNKPLLEENNIQNVIEMDWWERTKLSCPKMQMVPVQHRPA